LSEEHLPFDQKEIAAQLGHADDDVVRALLQLLAAALDPFWLTQWGDQLLGHHHWLVRQRVAELLGQGGTAEGLALLQQRWLVDEEEMVRDALLHGLAAFSVAGERH
jgi:hypothetical protein